MFDGLDEGDFVWAEESSTIKHYEVLFSSGFKNMIGKEAVRKRWCRHYRRGFCNVDQVECCYWVALACHYCLVGVFVIYGNLVGVKDCNIVVVAERPN